MIHGPPLTCDSVLEAQRNCCQVSTKNRYGWVAVGTTLANQSLSMGILLGGILLAGRLSESVS